MKKLTDLQKQYKKEIDRIKNSLYKYEKRGFSIPNEKILKIPKRVTKKALEKIKKTKPKEIVLKGFYGGQATQGEIISAKEGFKKEKEYKKQIRKNKKQKKTQVTTTDDFGITPTKTYTQSITQLKLNRFTNHIAQYEGAGAKFILQQIDNLSMFVNQDKIVDVLEKAEDNGNIFTHIESYDTSKANEYWHNVISALDLSDEQSEQLNLIIEEDENFLTYDN